MAPSVGSFLPAVLPKISFTWKVTGLVASSSLPSQHQTSHSSPWDPPHVGWVVAFTLPLCLPRRWRSNRTACPRLAPALMMAVISLFLLGALGGQEEQQVGSLRVTPWIPTSPLMPPCCPQAALFRYTQDAYPSPYFHFPTVMTVPQLTRPLAARWQLLSSHVSLWSGDLRAPPHPSVARPRRFLPWKHPLCWKSSSVMPTSDITMRRRALMECRPRVTSI